MRRLLTSAFALVMMVTSLSAQSSFVATGGDARCSGGKVSYSVGQVAIQKSRGGDIVITEGVQQTYKGVGEYSGIWLSAVLYPNPTPGHFQLTIKNLQLKNMYVRLYDVNGKYLAEKRIEGETTRFDISDYSSGTYFVNVFHGKKIIKSFKVVRKTE